MVSKSLQKPHIIEIKGSTIRVSHPDITGNPKTFVTSALTAAGTALTVADNNPFKDDDFILLGEPADNQTEEIDINGTVTRGTALTITNTTKFDHEISTPVYLIRERGIKIYGAATDGGSLTLIVSVDAITTPIADTVMIQWDKPYTEYTIISTDTAYAFYAVKFTDGTTDSSVSDYIASTGLTANTVEEIYKKALKLTNTEIESGANARITREFLIQTVDDAQDEIVNYTDARGIKKNWSFEVIEDATSIATSEGKNKYALSDLTTAIKDTDTNDAVIDVRFGNEVLDFIPIDEYDEIMEGKIYTEVATEATSGATSLVVDDSSELGGSGSLTILSQTITYTTNTKSTNTLSGIPASGTGSIATTLAVDDPVWQGLSLSKPFKYTVFDGSILVDVPINSDNAYKKLKIRYFKTLTALTEPTDTISVTFHHIMKWYVIAQIEYAKGNEERGDRFEAKFYKGVEINAQRDTIPSSDDNTYYEIGQYQVLR